MEDPIGHVLKKTEVRNYGVMLIHSGTVILFFRWTEIEHGLMVFVGQRRDKYSIC